MTSIWTKLRQRPLIWLLVLFAAVFWINGPSFTDDYGIPFAIQATHPTQLRLTPIWQYLYSSPLNYFIAYALRLNSEAGFYIIHTAEIILMLFAVVYSVEKKIGSVEKQTRFLTLLALTPIWLIIIKWIGKPDPVLIGLLCLCWALRTRWRILFVTIMVLAHREVGSLMALSLYFLEDRKDHGLIGGILIGNALQWLYQYGLMDVPPVSREQAMIVRTMFNIKAFLPLFPLYILTIFSWYWIVLLLNRPAWKEWVVFGVAFVLAVISDDFTRDFTLAALPGVLFHLERVVAKTENAKLEKLWPLALLHIQMAFSGQLFMADNMLIDSLF